MLIDLLQYRGARSLRPFSSKQVGTQSPSDLVMTCKPALIHPVCWFPRYSSK